ncbi:hypothetical protein SJAG_04428 [Schizosaccharomyces japonicus yFS275]|uniref:Peroxisome assembly protein 22 n=1 Tax=Schizosaccharomyces japonicus (strain yFS275 / FY16936) TaxID=402676 RepID=B6K6T9_SCHJY|nr:hypothetical protein SJAG_04428 [Schizosaccharomyces japonicus yFS275]EEB09243.2 hypothetical protein SJAG_04428 [Schizosaccharomyces japonicus yFS275]
MIPRKQTLGVRSTSITKNLTNYMMNSIKSCTRQKWLLLGASVIAAVALVIASRRLRVSSNHPQQKRSVLTIVDKNSRLSTIEKCYDKSALFLIYLMSPEMLKLQPVLEKLVEHPSRVLRCNRMENIIPLLRHMDVDELVWSAEWPEELKPGCSRYVKTISNAPTAHN